VPWWLSMRCVKAATGLSVNPEQGRVPWRLTPVPATPRACEFGCQESAVAELFASVEQRDLAVYEQMLEVV
jgi:hypothetical protein